MQTEIRPYCTTGKGQHDKVKSNFVRMFVEQFFSSLEDDEDYPPMEILDIDDHAIIMACQERGHKFSIITADDFLIPPDDSEE